MFEEFLVGFVLTGNLEEDIKNFFGKEFESVAKHSREVAACGKNLAERFNQEPKAAEYGGLLHDISAVIPNNQRIVVAEAWGIPVNEAERKLPMIVHQKLSRHIANEIFKINDESILSAIECHTTLKSKPTKMDQIVFIADKIKWDQKGEPPYLEKLLSALDNSLEEASLVYLNYLLNSHPKVIHPWALEAQTELNKRISL